MAAIAPKISLLPITQCSSSKSNARITKPLPRVRTPVGRRVGTIATLGFLAASIFKQPAGAFDFGLVAPDQTLEEALSGIRDHARGLLDIKEFIDSESWKDAQREMRMNAGYLKQDMYTIIQNKPGKERPRLRKMYSELFNNVTRLDYATRDMDKVHVLELYEKIVHSLNDILSTV
uniref:PsbQ-like protein 3, chloroplastic n=1 Tax=Kalanchoe fedtschenkoi TaxID=63787 RepID=A0A7N0RD79_KALFE